jgi:hypothetical protein
MNNSVNLPGMPGTAEKIGSEQGFIQCSAGICLFAQQGSQLTTDASVSHHKLLGLHIGNIDRYSHHFQQSGYNAFAAANAAGYTYPNGHNEK